MPKRKPLIDWYGTEIKVEPLMGSSGPCVDLEREWTEPVDYTLIKGEDRSSFDRLTPEQAIELGEWLREAAEAKL